MIFHYDFIPLFIKTWNKLYPDVDVKIIFISDSIPTKFIKIPLTINIILEYFFPIIYI